LAPDATAMQFSPRFAQGNEGNARWIFGIGNDLAYIQPFVLKQLKRLLAKDIGADFCNKRNGTAEALRRYGLVGTFAAGVHKKMAAQNRFAGRGQAGRFYYHIGIGTSDNYDRRFHKQVLFYSMGF
jgi:hypothetical protein